MNLSIRSGILFRAGYIIAMYSGMRAIWNRARSVFLPMPQAAILDGKQLRVNNIAQVLIRVHARSPPPSLTCSSAAGMLSVHLTSPRTPRPLYALLRMTSHFGCGHIEIAFYEEHDTVIFYAIRNIVRANADRIRCGRLLRNLMLCEDGDEIVLLQKLSQTFNDLGLKTSFASPEDCVTLSVNNLLLRPERRSEIRSTLLKRYARIWKKAEMRNS
jgi:hypothetical protein